MRRFASSEYGIKYLSMSISRLTYSQSGCGRYLSTIGRALGHANRDHFDMQWEAMIMEIMRLWSGKIGDALGGRNSRTEESHLVAVIKRVA